MTIDGYGVTSVINSYYSNAEKTSQSNSANAPTGFNLEPTSDIPAFKASIPSNSGETNLTGDDYSTNRTYMQVDSQRRIEEEEENKEVGLTYEREEEDEEDEKAELIEYLIEELKGSTKDLRMDGNKHIDRLKYLQNNYPNLMSGFADG